MVFYRATNESLPMFFCRQLFALLETVRSFDRYIVRQRSCSSVTNSASASVRCRLVCSSCGRRRSMLQSVPQKLLPPSSLPPSETKLGADNRPLNTELCCQRLQCIMSIEEIEEEQTQEAKKGGKEKLLKKKLEG
ncbi:uncharacterized protein [Triticum aestivum]|nr:uncharacterized protein LOC123127375 isoform X2 [Triticum aestivum]